MIGVACLGGLWSFFNIYMFRSGRNGFPSCRIALIEEGLFWEEVMGYFVGLGEEIVQEPRFTGS